MKYPKLPAGPTPVGAAKVRSLQGRGGQYQRSRTTMDTESRVSGRFSRATVGQVEYVTDGMFHLEKEKRVGTRGVLMPFIPIAGNPAPVNMGSGRYAGWTIQSPEPPFVNQTYTYTVDGDPVNFTQSEQSKTVYATSGSFWRRGNVSLATVQISVRIDPSQTALYASVPPLILTAPAEPHDDARQLMTVALVDNGRNDEAGKPLYDPLIVNIWNDYEPDGNVLDVETFTRPEAEFHDIIPIKSGKNATIALVGELFFQYDGEGPPMEPALWLLNFDKHRVSNLTATNMAPYMLVDRWLPSRTGYWMPGDGMVYNSRLSFTLGTMKILPLPGGVFLVFYRLFCDDNKWHNRIARIGSMGGSISFDMLSDVVEDESTAAFVQDAIHIGKGVVLTKVVRGFNGTGFNTELRKSSNNGTSWTSLPLSGFDLPGPFNQYFGSMTLHRAKTDDLDAVVLMPAWSQTDGAYFMYESRDEGVTWAKRGRIYKPDMFYRVDHMLEGDGGGNFELLLPGPNPIRAIDLAWPDRYDKD